MKMFVLDVVSGVSKAGKSFTQCAVRATGKNGDFLVVARCPVDFVDYIGTEIDRNIMFSQSGNFILDY